MAKGSRAGGGIARRNSISGAVAIRARLESPSASPSAEGDRDRDREAGAHPQQARDDVASHPLEEPVVGERREDLGQRREVEAVAAGGGQAPDREQHQRHRDLEPEPEPPLGAGAHRDPLEAGALGRVPVQHPALAPDEDQVEQVAEQAGGDDQRVHELDVAALTRDVDRLAEPRRADHELGRDHQDQRDRGGDPQAGGDVGDRARQGHPQQPAAARETERAGGVGRHGVGVLDPVERRMRICHSAAKAARKTALRRPVP